MKLLYATSLTFPSYRANRLQVMQTARALSHLLKDAFCIGVCSGAEHLQLPASSVISVRPMRAWRMALVYLRIAKEQQSTHLYCREERLLLCMYWYNRFLYRLPLTFCYELHHLEYARTFWRSIFLHRMDRIISITKGMKEVIVAEGYPEERVLVAPDAVDSALFMVPLSQKEARKELGLPEDTKIVMYTGDIDMPWKGAGTLHTAAKELPEHTLVLFVGSKPHHIAYFRGLYPDAQNIRYEGHQPHTRIPLYLRAADVLVLPNSASTEVSRISTSPMKLFEYMASGKPIVASDIPSIREVLDAETAILVPPDDASALAKGIVQALVDEEVSAQIGARACNRVSAYTWDARAASIVAGIV